MRNGLIFILGCVATTNSYAVSELELQKIAECFSATTYIETAFEAERDYKNAQNIGILKTRIVQVFSEKIAEYKQGKSYVESGYLEQMPNRSLAIYAGMGYRERLRYASGILKENDCYQYLQKR
jgi:hypothetical protein